MASAAINTQLKNIFTFATHTGRISFISGWHDYSCKAYGLFSKVAKPSLSELLHIPWFLWLGGILGVYAISTSIYTCT
ncbi:MAG: DMT family transporter [Acinetobacter sp.]